MDGTGGSRAAESLRMFDNHDPRIPYYELVLERGLEELPAYPLPAGYRFQYYAPGDRETWINIELSAREFSAWEDGADAWQRYYGDHEAELPDRMFFIVSPEGEKVATATAFYDIRKPDDGVNGMLHWVAVRRDHQSRGLSKPLAAGALRRMKELGYRRAVVPTQTTTWLACKVYLDLGFRPIERNAERNRAGWEIVKTLTGHPALEAFAETDVRRFLSGGQARAEAGAAVHIRFAEETDRAFWFSLDRHLTEAAFSGKVRDRTAYVVDADGQKAGLLRYFLFWDSIPFCSLLYVREDKQRQGLGRLLMNRWEQDMKARGYGLLMTSTQADESAQHFYRALGYRDCGGLTLPFPGYEQPTELILAKAL